MNHRKDAEQIVTRLREAGHVAYFAGGCVRDELLGRTPKDYDVATSASPETVQSLFSHTVPVGVQFGVIIVMTEDRQTEVATFRADGVYIDGRRPEGVVFTTAEKDAARRDFTMNGLFLDPTNGEVIDYVGGRKDITDGLIRAIGHPRERFREDKLRMLRAVRFTTTMGLAIDTPTWGAIREMSHSILDVSWERIREELSKIITSGHAETGLIKLRSSGLLEHILPEIMEMDGVQQGSLHHPEGDVLIHTALAMAHFDRLHAEQRTEVLGLATLLHDVGKPKTFTNVDRIRFNGHDDVGAEMADEILHRLRYPNEVIVEVVDLIKSHMAFTQIREWRGAKVRRFLSKSTTEKQLALHRLDALAGSGRLEAYDWCMAKLEEYAKEPPKPPKLLNGHELMAMGYEGGPTIGKILTLVEDEKLEGRLSTKEEATSWLLANHPPHKMSRVSTGDKIDDTVQAVCSCGWKGTAWAGHNDWQMTNVAEDEEHHRNATKTSS
jgi:putative nucleotidyltransferase with HDIG domain